jgi:hypothetical protein
MASVVLQVPMQPPAKSTALLLLLASDFAECVWDISAPIGPGHKGFLRRNPLGSQASVVRFERIKTHIFRNFTNPCLVFGTRLKTTRAIAEYFKNRFMTLFSFQDWLRYSPCSLS